ncbi:MAG: hypothetical protein R3B72_05720 [Polyangiaceae bacterium]
MSETSDAICTAKPRLAELLQTLLIYPVAGVMVTAFAAFGLDALFPDFLTDDHAANRWRMGAIFATVVVLLFVVTYRANRTRFYRLFEDRLVIGRGGEETIALADVQRVRVGAPAPSLVKKVQRANEVIGKVKTANANAAQLLTWQYARTVVLDLGERERRVINLSTVDRGEEMLQHLLTRLAEKVESPPSYTPEELAVFGRFVPRRYQV